MSTTTLTADERVVPVVRRLAAKLGVNPHALTGTGTDGRVLRSDVQAAALAARSVDVGTARTTAPAASSATPQAVDPFPGTSTVPATVTGPYGNGTVARNLHGIRGELPVVDPGPLAGDAWFPHVAAADGAHQQRAAAQHRPVPAEQTSPFAGGWFPGVAKPVVTDA